MFGTQNISIPVLENYISLVKIQNSLYCMQSFKETIYHWQYVYVSTYTIQFEEEDSTHLHNL